MIHINKHFGAVIGLMMVAFLCSFRSGTNVSAYSATLTTNSNVTVNVTPSHGTSIHEESINVISDCRAGYNLSIATPEGSDLYLYENGTQASNTPSITAVDGTSSLDSSNNTNKWGYTLSSNPTTSTVFSPLSSTPALLKTAASTASETNINDTFSIYYGTKVDNTVTPGTYKMTNNGAIRYHLTMDTTCTQYNVAFNPNGGTGSITNQIIETGESTKLTSSESLTAPQSGSYTDADSNTITGDPDKLWTFWGWNTEADGTGDWYKDREAVTDIENAGNTITLYAQWKQPTLADLTTSTPSGTEKTINHDEMQDMSPAACWNSPITTAANAPAATLKDYRGKVTTGENPESPELYTVSKLPDGLCWMTTNLNLGRDSGGANGDGTITLTSNDTDLAANTTFTLPASSTDYSSSTASSNINTPRVQYNRTMSYNIDNVPYSGLIASYYTYAAATADTTTYDRRLETITTSICPKNWDLPLDIQFSNLRTKGSITDATIAHSQPYTFTYGGYKNGASSFYNGTSSGYYWTSKNYNYSYAWRAQVNSSGLADASSYIYKYYGVMMRCVASRGTVTINYNGNGTAEYPVTGEVTSQNNVEINSANTQAGTGFTRTGWAFNGWNTAADGTGISITATTPISILDLKPGSTVTLYAQWLPQYTITYVNNCMTYASASSDCTQSVSNDTSTQLINLTNNPSTGTETGTLAAYNKFTLTGWKIKGWSTVADNSDNSNPEYGVGTTYTVPAGSSAGSGITLYAHWVPVYSIQYDGNNADNPNGMGTTDQSTGVKSVKQTNVGEGDPVVLLASNFKKAQYGFAGWSTDPDAWTHFTDNDNTNDPIIYGPMETIDAPAYPTNGTNIITMYAVWVPAETNSGNPVYLQDFTTSDCNALTKADFNTTTGVITPGSVIALTDKRDNQVYTVAKLADNNCWMVENLRLERAGTVGNNINDGSVTNRSLSQGYGGTTGTYGNFVGLAASESANFGNTNSNSVYKSSAASPTDTYRPANNVLEDIGTTDYPAYRFPRYNSDNTLSPVDSATYTQNYTNASGPTDSGTNYRTSSNIYSYGNYYTWAAAMANTNYYTASSASEAAGTSICPSNWHLPSSNGAADEYGTLSTSYGGDGDNQSGGAGKTMGNRFRTFPNNFLLSGRFQGSSASSRGTGGSYWSRSAYSVTFSNFLSLAFTSIGPSNSLFHKYTGFSVRCLIGS